MFLNSATLWLNCTVDTSSTTMDVYIVYEPSVVAARWSKSANLHVLNWIYFNWCRIHDIVFNFDT